MKALIKKYIIQELNKSLNISLNEANIPQIILEYSKYTILKSDLYGWFERPKNTKENRVKIYCAACQSSYESYKPIHNSYGECPACGQNIRLRRAESSKNYSIYNKDYICFFQKFGEVIVARFFNNSRYYRDYSYKGDFNPIEYQRIIFRKGSTKNFIQYNSWIGYKGEKYWSEKDKVSTHINNYHLLNNLEDLQDLFIGTHLEGSAWFDYIQMSRFSFGIESLYKFATWPVLEYLIKLGYKTLVEEIVCGRKREDRAINLYEKKANAVLGVPHSILQKYDPASLSECDIKAIKQLISYGRLGQLTPERMKWWSYDIC